MGLIVDKPELLAALGQADRDIQARQQEARQAIRALDDLAGDTTLTGQAWQAAKRQATDTARPRLERAIAQGERVMADNAIFRERLNTLIEDDYLNEDGIADCVRRMRRSDNLLRQAQDTLPDDARKLKGLLDRMWQQSEQQADRLEDKIQRLHALDETTRNLYQGNPTTPSGSDTSLDDDPNAVMARLAAGTMSEAEMAKMFQNEFGMSGEQAKELADFTVRFRKYAKKQGWKGKDELYWYANMIAAVTGDYRGFPWSIAAGTMSDKELRNRLKDMGIKDPKKFIHDIEKLHEGKEEHGRPLKNMKVDFVHEMGSLACILHTGKNADRYHSLTKGQSPNGDIWHTTSWYRESATWGGDIASGSFGDGDMASDMDAINLADLAERHPNADPIQLMTQYNQQINKDQDGDGYSKKRVDDFLKYYGRQYGDGSIASGRKFLEDNAPGIAHNSLGNQGLEDRHNLKKPFHGESDVRDAEKRFNDAINGKKWKHQ